MSSTATPRAPTPEGPLAAEERRLKLPPGSLAKLGCHPARRRVCHPTTGRWHTIRVAATPVLDQWGQPAGRTDRATPHDAAHYWRGQPKRATTGAMPYIAGDLDRWATTGTVALICEGVSDWQTAATVMAPLGITAIACLSTGAMAHPQTGRTLTAALAGKPARPIIIADPDKAGLQAAAKLAALIGATIVAPVGVDLSGLHQTHHRADPANALALTRAAIWSAAQTSGSIIRLPQPGKIVIPPPIPESSEWHTSPKQTSKPSSTKSGGGAHQNPAAAGPPPATDQTGSTAQPAT